MARTTRTTAIQNARKASPTPMAKKTPIPKVPASMLKTKKPI